MEKREGRGYPSDVTDEEWAFVSPYLALCKEDAEQRDYPLRAVFNGLRYVVRTGCQWRYMPNDLPPWNVVYQQAQRWIRARCFETMVEDLRMLLREFAGRKAQPTAMILDSRTLQSTPESGARAGGVMPSKYFGANAAWRRLAVLTFNVLTALKRPALPPELLAARPKRLRFLIFTTPGKLLHHARRALLRLPRSWNRVGNWRHAIRLLPAAVAAT